jgi:hypothetical protein
MGRMPGKPLGHNALWGVEDAIALALRADRAAARALARAKRTQDPTLVALIAEVQGAVKDVRRKLRDARRGEYEDDGIGRGDLGSSAAGR